MIGFGEILLYEYILPNSISIPKLSYLTNISYSRLNDIIFNNAMPTYEECIKFSDVFNTTADFFINLSNFINKP